MFKPLGDLLPDALSRMKVRKPVEAAQICRVVDQVLGATWDHAVPMRTLTYKNGTVTIAVTSSAWAHEVQMKVEKIKDAANHELGEGVVNRLRTTVSDSDARGEPNY